MLRHRILLAVTAIAALVAVAGASGQDDPINSYAATGSPTHVKPSTQAAYRIALTNDALSPDPADKAKIGIPAGFVVAAASVQATTNASDEDECEASTWVADGTLIADGNINLKRPGGGENNRLCPRRTLTVTFSATSSAAEGTSSWTTLLRRGEEAFVLNGPQPTVTVDGTAPETSIDSAPTTPTNSMTATFAFSSTEAGSSFECRLDAGTFAACSSPKTYPGLAPGAHTFRVRATDSAENTDGSPAIHSWTIDTAAPNTSITEAPPTATNQTGASFSFSSTEAGSTFECSLDGAAFLTCLSPRGYSGLAKGAHSFAVRATDQAGNTDASPATHGWTVDTDPPEVTIDGKPNNPSNDKTPTFAFSANEPATFHCRLDTGSFMTCASPTTYTLSDGTHTFTIRAVDNAGNADEETYEWLLETKLPVVVFSDPPRDPTASSSATFAFTVMKGDSVVDARVSCTLDGTVVDPCTSPRVYTGLADGRHTFAARATDAAGNTGPETVHAWMIDTTGPATAITEKPADPTNARSATFAFASEAGVTFQCRLDDAAFANCESRQSFTGLAEGRHTFVVRGSDTLGNVGPEAVHAWTIETTAPAVAITAGPPALGNGTAASLSFSADEAATFQCNLDDRGFESCGSPAAYAGLREGGHAFVVRATDAAGNVGAASRSWTIDTTAPDTTLASRPPARTTATTAAFRFSTSEAGTFECRLDGGSFSPCTSPKTYRALARGRHSFAVRAVDLAGNVDATPSLWQWTLTPATRRVAASPLFAPPPQAQVTRPPLLRWRAVRRATYYNVQLYRAGRKVLTTWPTRARLQLRARWRFNGRVQTLEPGSYRWWVWPAYGRPSAQRYGRVLGTSTFVVARGARGR